MSKDVPEPRRTFEWGLAASVALHVLVAAILVFELPPSHSQPQEEEAVQVELVPPPEPPQQAEDEPPPAEAAQEEPPPVEEAQPEPEEPPPVEEAQPEPPPPMPQPEDQQQAEAPPPPEVVVPQGLPPVLDPVFRFGEQDAGPRVALDGNSAEEAAQAEEEAPADEAGDTEEAAVPSPEEAAEEPTETAASDPPGADVTEAADEAAAAETREEAPTGTAASDPQEVEATQEAAVAEAAAAADAEAADAEAADETEMAALVTPEIAPRPSPPDRRPASAPATATATAAAPRRGQARLEEARTLFSRTPSGAASGMTAMGTIPRDERAGRLCLTELREQLRRGFPPYFPDLLPSHEFGDGNVSEISRTAFRSNRQWYDLSYRCEVDSRAMQVVAFAFRVGEPIPRSEWLRRGLAAQ